MIDLLQLQGVKPIGQRIEDDTLLILAESNVPEPESCSGCGSKPVYKHGKRKHVYADTPMHGMPVRVEIERQRYRCQSCGTVIVPNIPSFDEKRIVTKRLIDFIQGRCFNNTFTLLANETGLAINTIKAIALDYTEELETSVFRETPRLLGLDEVMISGGYRAVMVNLEMNTLFDIHDNRKLASMRQYFEKLKDKENIEWVCADMWEPYKVLISEQIPQAKLVIDRFHVIKMASKAMEQIRKKLQSELSHSERLNVKKNIRWSLLKGSKSKSEYDHEVVEYIRENYPELALAYDLKETFFNIYELPDRASGEMAYKEWKDAVPQKFSPEFNTVIKIVDSHYEDIFNYFDCPITNGYTEAMNGVMKAANRLGRGYSYEVIRAKLLFSKIARQSGSMIMQPYMDSAFQHKEVPSGEKSVRDYGASILTLDTMAERGDLD
jgi:transposase